MSKMIYICFRDNQPRAKARSRLEKLTTKIIPDHINPRPTCIIEAEGILAGIYNPADSNQVKGTNLLLGEVDDLTAWDEIGEDQPEGTFVIVRCDNQTVQVITDAVASRTVWYFLDEEKFIAATSQRALIAMVGDFQFNEKVIPWMLSTGSLGYQQSWDRRVKRMPGDACLSLDRRKWTLTERVAPLNFTADPSPIPAAEKNLTQVLTERFADLRLDYSHWALLLSGGFDSRSILCLLKSKTGLQTVTWGTRQALNEPRSDAAIAQQLANHFRLQHRYFEIDFTDVAVETLLSRYLLCGDGEIDHIGGYIDGFQTWKKLFDMGVQGIIRGDEGFGWVKVGSPQDVRLSLGLPLLTDFSNLKDLNAFQLPPQEFPRELQQQPSETLATWRDRLYHQFRLPVVLGALSDLKLAYVEIINPLLTRKIIHATRRLPDDLRTEKKLYKKIVSALSPAIPFARQQALVSKHSVLKEEQVVVYLRSALGSNSAQTLFSQDMLDFINAHLQISRPDPGRQKRASLKNDIKKLLPRSIISSIKKSAAKPNLDINLLAFRVFMITQMYRQLSDLNIDLANN